MEALFKKNWQAFAAHLGSFILLLVLYLYYKSSQKHADTQTFRYTIPNPKAPIGGSTCNTENDSFSGNNTSKCNTEIVYAPPKKLLNFNLIYGCLLFFAVTAFAHIFYATDAFGTKKYSAYVLAGSNPYRWAEYGVSASVMTVLISAALGLRDFNHITSLVLINVALQTCGFIVENSLIQPSPNLTVVGATTFAGWVLFLAMWVPILLAFYWLWSDVKENLDETVDPDTGKPVKLPGFLWFIVIVQLLNFAGFGIIQALQVYGAFKGTPVPYTVTENRYLILSFVGKLGLASGLGYGLLLRTKSCP